MIPDGFAYLKLSAATPTIGGVDYRPLSSAGLGVIVRLNNGYFPAGTIPTARPYADFARRVLTSWRRPRAVHVGSSATSLSMPTSFRRGKRFYRSIMQTVIGSAGRRSMLCLVTNATR